MYFNLTNWHGEQLAESERFLYITPEACRDNVCHDMFCDEKVMVPHLECLYNMSVEDMVKRRAGQREGFKQGKQCFMDIVEQTSGRFVGTCGFRSIEDKTAEWGVIISSSFHRKGIATEAFTASKQVLKDRYPKVKIVTACTLPANTPMITFFEKHNWKKTGLFTDDHTEYVAYQIDLLRIPPRPYDSTTEKLNLRSA